ncbi:MAG: hypothetical protein ACRDZ4_17215 [Egibacteraceae bacterium]
MTSRQSTPRGLPVPPPLFGEAAATRFAGHYVAVLFTLCEHDEGPGWSRRTAGMTNTSRGQT